MNNLHLKNKYAPLSIALHWLTVILMIAIYASIELHEAIPRGNPLRGAMEDWHIYLGLTVFALAAFRLAVNLRLTAPPITPPPPVWQLRAVKGMKVYLYVLLLLAPLLGWLYLSAEGEAIVWFFVSLPALAPASESLAGFAGEAHEILGLSGYFLVGIHALAALYHHYVVRDDTLRRILPAFLSKQS